MLAWSRAPDTQRDGATDRRWSFVVPALSDVLAATLTAGKITEKTELRRKVELPPSTSQMLLYFIHRALPLLRAPGDDANAYLFPSRKHDRHTTSGELGKQSQKLTARRTRVVGMTGHKSRHVSVKLHLEENPGDWTTVQEHVGHRDAETTRIFYANVTHPQVTTSSPHRNTTFRGIVSACDVQISGCVFCGVSSIV